MDGPDQSRRILCEDGCSMGFIRMLCQVSSKNDELSEGKSFNFTYNKALQKIIESYRVSTEDKEIIRSMKRKNK
jgi:hypothetical protein